MIIKHNGSRVAVFSDCEKYRYLLADKLVSMAPMKLVTFIMLNPSTADHMKNDPTVRKCSKWTVEWGYTGLAVVNLFALRSVTPDALYDSPDPVGPHNLSTVIRTISMSKRVICAWGRHGSHMGMGENMLKLLIRLGVKPHALKTNLDGSPAHPLYLKGASMPFPLQHIHYR